MRQRIEAALPLAVLVGSVLMQATEAFAQSSQEHGWAAGKLRLELAGFTGIHSGRRSRTGDYGLSVSVEYEVPVIKHLTLGIKGYPLFFYEQDDSGEDTVFGVGIGPQLRAYHREDFRGLFGEVGFAALATSGKFDGNSATLNLLSEGGIGYKFKSNWHVAAKFRHISNAGLASSNSGVNTVVIGLGYTF